MARSFRQLCPPGVLCIPDGIINVAIIILFVVLIFLIAANYLRPTTLMMPHAQASALTSVQAPNPIYIQNGGDSRYDRAPQPLRDWRATPEFLPRGVAGQGVPAWGHATQGLPESFQSVGIVNVGEQVLPLYGRRTTGSNDRWNYYTRTDTYNPVPVPVRFQKRDCMDDVGCQEIMSGETVKIDALRKEGQTDIYRFDGPKYIPGLI